jgi:hypothetical protein
MSTPTTKLSPRERRLATITLAVMGCAVLYLSGIAPALTRYGDLSGAREGLSEKVAKLERSIRENRHYKRELSDLKRRIEAGDAALVWNRVEQGLVARELKLVQSTKSNPERRPKSAYSLVRFQLQLEGSLTSVVRLLELVESDSGLLRAHAFEINAQPRERFSVSLSLSTLTALDRE